MRLHKMFEISPQTQAVLMVIAVPLLTGLGVAGKMIFDRLFPSRQESAQAAKIRAEGQHISLAHGLQAFQVSDESLSEWIKTGTTATREMLRISRKFNEVEMLFDDVINLMERAFKLIDGCEIEGKDQLFRQFEDLKTERARFKETQ